MFAKVLQPFFGAFIGQYIIMNAAQFKINNNYQRTDAGKYISDTDFMSQARDMHSGTELYLIVV
jgi:hypothetical protein